MTSGTLGVPGYTTATTKRMFTVGNFSKFIRPGYVRLGATTSPASGIYTSAYKDPASNAFVLVAINTTNSDRSLAVTANVGLSTVSYATTSATQDLQTSATTIVPSGGAFSAPLPAQSVTTFVSTRNDNGGGGGGTQSLLPGVTPSTLASRLAGKCFTRKPSRADR